MESWAVVASRKPQPKPRKVVQKEEKVVLPRKVEEEDKEQPWKPNDLKVDPERRAKLMEKMYLSIRETKNSHRYTTFFEQLKSPEVSEQFRLLLGFETQVQMVIYGLGSFEREYGSNSRFQLSIALLMKREFDWIGEIQVFDPVFSATECTVLTSLGCTVLYVNENARREALKPTLFFMLHCGYYLYSNLLQTNWGNDRLSNIALLGNSFKDYEEEFWHERKPIRAAALKQIKDARKRITREFAIECYSGSSWHFFSPGKDKELPLSDFSLFPPLTE